MKWLASYVALTAVFVLTPGAATALVFRNSLRGGRRAGLATASGIALGNSTYAAAAGIGLSSLLMAAPGALTLVRVLGACYLGWLGVVGIGRAIENRPASAMVDAAAQDQGRQAPRGPFIEGLTTNLLNPAIPLFYATYVPQFVVPTGPFWPRFAALAAVHVTMALSMHSVYACALGTASSTLMGPATRRGMELVTGLMLVGLSLHLAWP